jgi:hypothetical protein
MDYVDEFGSGKGETGVRETKSQSRVSWRRLVYECDMHEMDWSRRLGYRHAYGLAAFWRGW